MIITDKRYSAGGGQVITLLPVYIVLSGHVECSKSGIQYISDLLI